MPKITVSKDLVAVLGDIQNVPLIKNYGNLLQDFAKSEGRLNCSLIYYNSQHKNQVSAMNNMQSIGYKGIDVPDPSKNSADKQLIYDCIRLVASTQSLQKIILVLGDRDYAGLISVLLSLGKKVIIFAQRGSTSRKLVKLVGDENFHFIDELPKLVGEKTQPQTDSIPSQISYNDAVNYLLEAINAAISQGKGTGFGPIGSRMRQLFPQYQGVEFILTPDGKKFSKFTNFVEAVAKDGKVRIDNKELFLI